MEERSPNSEPDGSRRVPAASLAVSRASAFPLVSARRSRPSRRSGTEARLVRADWLTGNREARPGLR
jgi:hypothetical protein